MFNVIFFQYLTKKIIVFDKRKLSYTEVQKERAHKPADEMQLFLLFAAATTTTTTSVANMFAKIYM